MSYLGQPTVPTHYLLAGTLWSCPAITFYCSTLGQSVIKVTSVKSPCLLCRSFKNEAQRLFLHFEEHSNSISKMNLLSTGPPQIKMLEYNKIIIIFFELKKKKNQLFQGTFNLISRVQYKRPKYNEGTHSPINTNDNALLNMCLLNGMGIS